jgi:hypothetical protein
MCIIYTSEIRKVLYDMSTNRADSSNGNSRTLVNFVIKLVAQPIAVPIINDIQNTTKKSFTACINATKRKSIVFFLIIN